VIPSEAEPTSVVEAVEVAETAPEPEVSEPEADDQD